MDSFFANDYYQMKDGKETISGICEYYYKIILDRKRNCTTDALRYLSFPTTVEWFLSNILCSCKDDCASLYTSCCGAIMCWKCYVSLIYNQDEQYIFCYICYRYYSFCKDLDYTNFVSEIKKLGLK